jgi:hypothetical protein
MIDARQDRTASVLTNGNVLFAAGFGGGYLTSVEFYDPSTITWTTTASMNNGCRWHTASVLRNDRVLVTAGYNGRAMSSAELY